MKRFYARTNKNKFTQQCARQERRQSVLRKLKRTADKAKQQDGVTTKVALGFTESEPLPFTSPRIHHHISESNRFYVTISKWLGTLVDDPAVVVCSNINEL